MSSTSTSTGIVVGVDGSEPSLAALQWAVRQARLTGSELTAVMGWHVPPGLGFGNMLAIRDGAEKALNDVVNSVPTGDVVVHQVFREGVAAAVLLEVSEGAGLLVVGSRGRGGFTGLLLGSVSVQCVNHATCPVVVIHAAQPQGAQSPE